MLRRMMLFLAPMSEGEGSGGAAPTPAPTNGDGKAPVVADSGSGATDVPKPDADKAKPPEHQGEPEKKPERIAAKIEDIRKRVAKLAEREAAMATTQKEYDAAKAKVAELEAMKGDARAALKWFGFKDATEFAKAMVRDPETSKAMDALEKYKAEQADKEKKASDAQAAREEQENRAKGTARIKGEIEKLGDAAEFAKAKGDVAVQDVIDLCQSYYDQHGKLPDLEAAIKQVDAFYEADFKTMSGTKRGKALTAPAPDPKAADKKTPDPEKKPAATLADGMGGNKAPPADATKPSGLRKKGETKASLTAEIQKVFGGAK